MYLIEYPFYFHLFSDYFNKYSWFKALLSFIYFLIFWDGVYTQYSTVCVKVTGQLGREPLQNYQAWQQALFLSEAFDQPKFII